MIDHNVRLDELRFSGRLEEDLSTIIKMTCAARDRAVKADLDFEAYLLDMAVLALLEQQLCHKQTS